jgi:hypothetical protein
VEVKKDPRITRRNLLIISVVLLLLGSVTIFRVLKAREHAGMPPPPPPTLPSDYPGDNTCTHDEDCSPSQTCTYCGQCFSEQPRLQIDCKMYCLKVSACACVQGRCVVADAGR